MKTIKERPIRVQRKRVKGWKMPENTVSVTRPGKWGNPFRVVEGKVASLFDSILVIEDMKVGGYMIKAFCKTEDEAFAKCLQMYQDWLLPYKHGESMEKFYLSDMKLKEIVSELGGKNLACFCKPGAPCHADILLKLANP